MYDIVKHLHIELTDKCNARCPQCVRTDPKTGEEQPWLIKAQLYLEDFKLIVAPDDIKNLKSVNFCGNYGEPLVAKDLIPIVEYLYTHNPKLYIQVATNGSVRSEDWWWDLLSVVKGKGKRFKVIFGLDGINQEQHVLYRQNTSFDRIMENAEFFINNGGHAEWQYLIFKHNEHTVEEGRRMAEEKGFKNFMPVSTERFWFGDTFEYNFKGKQYKLERSTTIPNKKQLMNIQNYGEEKQIKCFAQATQEAYIDCLGYITPCCYLGMCLYASIPNRPVNFHSQQDLMEMVSNMDLNHSQQELVDMFSNMDLNRLKGKLSDVVKDPWFFELTLMHSQLKPERCYEVCGAGTSKKEYA